MSFFVLVPNNTVLTLY